ncbi:MAG: response regulator transcription factor [Blautia sp.]
MKEKIKVLIAEDVAPIRKRYLKILNSHPSIEVVGDVESGTDACILAKKLKPDIVLMDIEMECKDAGIRATGEILAENPQIKIIILTVYEEDELIFSAFRLGACDYILKNSSEEDIISGVIGAYHNSSPIRPEIADKIRNEFQRVKTYESSFLFMLNLLSTLTPRELDTLYLLSNGYSKKDICEMRCVEMSTVKSQVHNILKKFNKKKIADIITTDTDRHLLGSILNNTFPKT